jgi:Chemoreceptor zinc-binding domain
MGFLVNILKNPNMATTETLLPLSDFQQTANSAATILAEIDLDAAIALHKDWGDQLHNYLSAEANEQLNPVAIALDDQCLLGKWLDGAGQEQFGTHPAFAMLMAQHKRFHEEAAEIISLANAKNFDQATERLHKNFAYANRQLEWLLRNLKNNLRFMVLA